MRVPPDCIQVFVQGKDVLMNRGMVLRALVSLASLVIWGQSVGFFSGRARAGRVSVKCRVAAVLESGGSRSQAEHGKYGLVF
jgi:hypothetical protein